MPTMLKSSITTKPPIEGELIPLETPGEMLRQDFLEAAGITSYRLAKSIGVPQTYISKVLRGGRISPELALLMDRFFGLSEGFWSRLQADYNSRVAKRKLGDRLNKVQPYHRVA
jgi:addiction module HigA family antidote